MLHVVQYFTPHVVCLVYILPVIYRSSYVTQLVQGLRLVPTEWVAPHPLTLGWKQCMHCFQLCMEPPSVPYRMEVCRHRGGHLHNLITRGAQFVVLLLSLDSQPHDHNV